MAVTSAPTLDRAIGPVAATLLVIGGIVGSGIFLTTGRMAEVLPSPTLVMLAWVVGGLFALAGALTYAEMSAMYPRAGGVYIYLREAFGPLLAFLYGWAALLIFFSGGIAAVSVGFAEYVSYFVPSLSVSHVLWRLPTPIGAWTVSAAQIVAVACITVQAAVNYIGVRSGNRVNATVTIAKVAGLAALPIMALVTTTTSPAWGRSAARRRASTTSAGRSSPACTIGMPGTPTSVTAGASTAGMYAEEAGCSRVRSRYIVIVHVRTRPQGSGDERDGNGRWPPRPPSPWPRRAPAGPPDAAR